MKHFVTLIALLLFANFNVTFAADNDLPFIIKYGEQYNDVVTYPERSDGRVTEAWEIIVKRGKGTYLNYSRFPYGDITYGGVPTQICYTNIDGNKFVGVSENAQRLQMAMEVVITNALARTIPTNITCKFFSLLLKENPLFSDLDKFFESI